MDTPTQNQAEDKPSIADRATLVMPGTAEQAAKEISDYGPEGAPVLPRLGPGALWLGIGVLSLVLVLAAVVVGFLWSWPAGGVVLSLGLVGGLILNPVVAAATMRADDRAHVVKQHADQSGQMRATQSRGTMVGGEMVRELKPTHATPIPTPSSPRQRQ